MDRPAFRWNDGVVIVDLLESEQKMLSGVMSQYHDVLSAGEDRAVRRLHPPAYPDDGEAEAAYRAMIDDDLSAQRLEALETVRAGIAGDELDEYSVSAWLRTMNGLRLLLGTRLGIDTDEDGRLSDIRLDDPRNAPAALYDWLGHMLEELVDAAGRGLAED